MVSLSLHHPFSLAAHLVADCAILTLPGVPLIRHLLADVEWVSDRDGAFLALQEDLSLQPEYLRFDRLAVHSFGVTLERGADVIAVITSIDRAGLSFPEEFRQRWERWRSLGAPIPAKFPDRAGLGTPGAPRGRGAPLPTSL